MIDNYNIDQSRIYVTGMSLGGYSTMKYVDKYFSRVAAAIALCGGGELADTCALTTVPIKLIDGDKDFIVSLSESKRIMRVIQTCDIDSPIELEVVRGGTHGSVEDLYRHIELYHWLLTH